MVVSYIISDDLISDGKEYEISGEKVYEISGDDTLYEISGGDVNNVISQLEIAYLNAIRDKIKSFQDVFTIDSDGKNMTLFKEFNDIKEKNKFQDSQNESTKIAFMERYLYLIIKVIFFIILLITFLYRIRDQLVFNFNFSSAQQQISMIGQKTNESIRSLGDKSNSSIKTNTMVQKNNT